MDRINNYAQGVSEIATLESIRNNLGVEASEYTPDESQPERDRVFTFAQQEKVLSILADIDTGVANLVAKADTNAENIATNTANIAQNQGSISANNKRISNIEKLLQGNLYDYQTDSTSAYTKSVPAGAMPYASLEQIGGKTLVWNQLVDTGTTTVNTISGHKYYTLIDGTASIVTSDGTAISVVDDTADMVRDLTLMFGSGNEPSTVEEFEAMFPASYYAFTQGTLLSAGVTEVVSQGRNLINTTDFLNVTSQRSAGNVTLKAGTYTLSATVTNNQGSIVGYLRLRVGTPLASPTVNFNILGADSNVRKSASFTLAEDNIVYLEVAGASSGYNISVTQIQIQVGATATDYVPYVGTIATYPIPAEIRNIEGYGWSAGTAYNYIDYEAKKFVKRVGSVDLGTLTWFYNSTQNFFYVTVDDMYSGTANVIVNRYSMKASTTGWGSMVDYEFGVSNQQLRLHNSAYSDANAFKSAMNGVYAYYELATPIEVDISQYLTDDNLISVEAGGTLTFPNQHGDDYRIPVPSAETYMVDLQSAIGG